LWAVLSSNTFFNNTYEVWTLTASPILAGPRILFCDTADLHRGPSPFHTVHLRKEEIARSGNPGILRESFRHDRTRLTGAPVAVPAILSLNGHLYLSSIANTGTAPYADFQLISLLAGPSGNVTFWPDVFVHVVLPIILVMIGFLIARPKMFVQILERA